jgi:DNA-binding NarL/FixJ family response regulator
MKPRLTVLIADDHPLFLAGVRKAIESIPAVQVVAEAINGRQALDEIQLQTPRIAILDIRMPELTGIQVLKELRKRNLDTQVIFLTMYDDQETFDEAMDMGAMGYVSKESAVDDMMSAIDAVRFGKYYISPLLMNLMVNRCANPQARSESKDPTSCLTLLTAAERRVLKLISESMSSRQIAESLFISLRTVENHRAHICTKLEIHGSYSLLKFALENRTKL